MMKMKKDILNVVFYKLKIDYVYKIIKINESYKKLF